jgi:NAD(P)H-dependent FMN reductase
MTQISGSSTAADNLEASALGVVTGTAVTGTLTTTAFTTNLTEVTDNHYNNRVCVFTSGVLAGQAKAVTDYDGASKTLTTRAFTEAPSNADAFVLV